MCANESPRFFLHVSVILASSADELFWAAIVNGHSTETDASCTGILLSPAVLAEQGKSTLPVNRVVTAGF